MPSLSHDVMLDVLCRLGVKDLLRFSCIKPEDDLSFFPHYCYFLSVDFDSIKTAQQLNHPFDDGRYTLVLGSCNGLLALFDGRELALWNPSTRESQILPLSEIEFPPGCFETQTYAYGLGYDSTSDDYKVVRVVQFDSLDSEVKVYSLKTNSWRRIKDFPFYLEYGLITYGFQASNALHWVVSRTPETEFHSSCGTFGSIVALDLEAEEFHLVELPEGLGNCFHIYIRTMGGCLVLIASDWARLVSDIWVMEEYGVKESWTKLVSLNQFMSMPDFRAGRPLAFSRDGHKVLLYNEELKLVWYDRRSKRVEQIRIEGVPSRFWVEMLVESLVPLNRNAAMINKEKKQPSEKRQKEERKKNKKRDDFLSEGFHLVL